MTEHIFAISDKVKRQLYCCRSFLEVNSVHTSCMSDVQIQIFRICVYEKRKAACSQPERLSLTVIFSKTVIYMTTM